MTGPEDAATGRWDRSLVQLYVATFLFALIMGIGFPLVPQHLRVTFRADPTLIGLLMGAHGVMQIVLRLPLGDLADRRGRRPSLIATFVLCMIAGGFYVWGPTGLWMLPGQLLFGVASGLYWVAANAYLFDRVHGAQVHHATSDYAVAVGAGLLVGPPLGGVIADRFGFGAGLSVFIWAGLIGALLVATLPEAPVHPDRARRRGQVHRRALRIFRHPDIRVSALGTLLFSTLFGTLGAFFPVLLRDLRYTAFAVGMLLATRQAASLAVRIWIPHWLGRHGPRNVLLAGLTVAAGATAAIPWATDLMPLVLLSIVGGIGLGVLIPANLTLINRGSPRDERGLANGIYGTALGVGTTVAPWLLGPVGDRFGISWTFWGAGLAGVVGALVLVRMGRGAQERDTPPPLATGEM